MFDIIKEIKNSNENDFLKEIKDYLFKVNENLQDLMKNHKDPVIEFSFQFHSNKDKKCITHIAPYMFYNICRNEADLKSKQKEILNFDFLTQQYKMYDTKTYDPYSIPKYIGFFYVTPKNVIIQYISVRELSEFKIEIIEFEKTEEETFNWISSAQTGLLGSDIFNEQNDQFFIDLSKTIKNNYMNLLCLPDEKGLSNHQIMDYKIQKYHKLIPEDIKKSLSEFTKTPLGHNANYNLIYLYRKDNFVILFSKPENQKGGKVNLLSIIKSKENHD